MTEAILEAVAISHLAATLFMVGAIWFVQVVHYPLMAGQTPAFAREHARRTGWVLAPVMLVELGTAGLLAWSLPAWPTLVGLALLLGIWVSTWCVQVPCHARLAMTFDASIHRRLVTTNWVRTILWSLRGGMAVWMVLLTTARGGTNDARRGPEAPRAERAVETWRLECLMSSRALDGLSCPDR